MDGFDQKVIDGQLPIIALKQNIKYTQKKISNMFFDEDEIENAFFHDTTTNEPHQHSEDMLYSEEEEFAMKIVEEIYRERSLHDQQMMLLQRKRKLSNSNNSGASYKCSVSSSLSSPLVLCDDEKVLLSHLPSRRTHDKVDWKEYCDMTMR